MVDILEQKKQLFAEERAKIKKKYIQVSKQLDHVDPTNPLYAKLLAEKEQLTIQLYGKDMEFERKITQLTKRLSKVEEDKTKVSPKEDQESANKKGFFQPKSDRIKEGVMDKINEIEDTLLYRTLYQTTKLTYSTLKNTVKATAKTGSFIGKAIAKAALTKRIDTQRKFGFIPVGGKRVGRFKFKNNNLLRKYSSDYKDVGNDFYFLGKGLYNRKIKKGELDAGDIIEYLRSQGKTSAEILEQLDIFMDQGLVVSKSIQEMLENQRKTYEREKALDYSDVETQKHAIFIDDTNKQVLKETLLDFYKYMEDQREAKEKKEKKKKFGILDMVGSLIGKVFGILKWVGLGVAALLGPKLLLMLGAALVGAVFMYGKNLVGTLIEAITNWWNGKEASANVILPDDLEKVDNEDYLVPHNLTEVPKYTSTGDPIPEDIRTYIKEASEKTGVDPYRIAAKIEAESNWDPKAVSQAGAKGLMQFMDKTWDEVGQGDVFDPRANILAGAEYIKQTEDWAGGDKALADAYYNYGKGNVDRLRAKYGADYQKYLPKETKDYVRKNVTAMNTLAGQNSSGGFQVASATPTTDKSSYKPGEISNMIMAEIERNKKNQQEIQAKKQNKEGVTQVAQNTNTRKAKNPTPPISIPTHLGGAGLDLLNTPVRV